MRGGQLAPRDGAYDLRITAELWETHFFDLVSLLVVDHPAGTEVFVDERFAVPPPALDVHRHRAGAAVRRGARRSRARCARSVRERATTAISTPRAAAPIRASRATTTSSSRSAGRRAADADRCGWSRRAGSTRPTARSTSRSARAVTPRPRGLSLEVAGRDGTLPDGRAPDSGFPAGKDKTVLIDLDGLFAASGPRRLRLSHEPGDLLGPARLGRRAARRRARAAHAPADVGRPALPRVFA